MRIILTTFIFVVGTFVVNAQAIRLTGTIYDPTGAVVPGAKLEARYEKGGLVSTKSDAEGKFALELRPGIHTLEIAATGFLTINYGGYLIVNATDKKMTMDVVMFGAMDHEPCGYGGANCLPPNKRIKSYRVIYSPSLKKIRDDFSSETKPEKYK
jgi:hypothetical protein